MEEEGSRARACQERRDGLDIDDEKQKAQKEDSPDLRQGEWVQSDPDGGESDGRQSRGRDEADPERRGRACDNTRKSAEKKRKAGELR